MQGEPEATHLQSTVERRGSGRQGVAGFIIRAVHRSALYGEMWGTVRNSGANKELPLRMSRKCKVDTHNLVLPSVQGLP